MRYMSLKDHVYEYLSQKIQQGDIKPNDKLNEQVICKELGVSRTPVREALIHLAADGLLTSEPRRGFRVKPLGGESIREIYEIVGVLDAMAAKLAFDRINQDDIDIMKTLKSQMDDAIEDESLEDYYKLQIDFHNIYIDKCDNDELIKLLSRLRMRFIKQTYIINEKVLTTLRETNEQHSVITQLFEKNNAQDLEDYLINTHWNIEHSILEAV